MTMHPDEDMRYISPRGLETFQVRIPAGKGLYGRRNREHRTVHGTLADAHRVRDELLHDRDAGTLRGNGQEFLRAYLPRWHGGRVHLRWSSVTAEAEHLVLLIEGLGWLRLRELEHHHVAEYAKASSARVSCRGRRITPKTVRNNLAVLRKALNDAVRDGLIPHNPVRWTEAQPRYEPDEVKPLEPEEIDLLLEASRGTPLALVTQLGLDCGLRCGELVGLRLGDLRLDKAQLHVAGQLIKEDSELVWHHPKSKHSVRDLPLSPETVTMTREWIARRGLDQGLGAAKRYLFSEADGRPWSPPALSARFSRFTHGLGLDATLHTLRHTFISYHLLAKTNLKTLIRLAGHKDGRLILGTYGHIIERLELEERKPALGLMLDRFRADPE